MEVCVPCFVKPFSLLHAYITQLSCNARIAAHSRRSFLVRFTGGSGGLRSQFPPAANEESRAAYAEFLLGLELVGQQDYLTPANAPDKYRMAHDADKAREGGWVEDGLDEGARE
jgi:hypothetical protein